MNDVMKVVVAGTSFGRIYLDAVRSDPDLALAGILGRGSRTTRALAEQHGVPMLTSVADVGDDVDMACVVIGSAVNGGPGAEIAQAFLRRGIHVLQEHPLHPAEIVECLRAARQGGAVHHVSTLYPDVEPVRCFLAAAQRLREQQPVLFVDAACSSQVLYPLLDMIGRALGGVRPWAFAEPTAADAEVTRACRSEQPFQSVQAAIAGVPVALRVQNQINPADRDNHALLLHRLALGFEGGVLTLADSHGPVLWNPRMYAPRDEEGRLVPDGPANPRLDAASTRLLGDWRTRTYREVFTRVWPDAVGTALRRLREEISAEPSQRTTAQWGLAVSRVWADLTARLGPPQLIDSAAPQPVSPI